MRHFLSPFLEVAAAIRSATGVAHLAGGCLRDTIFGKPVKDVDVFVHANSDFVEIEAALAGAFGSAKLVMQTDFSSCAGMADVLSSMEYLVGPEGLRVNVIELIGTPTLMEVLQRMDFGICQVGHDGEDLVFTEAYEIDAALHTFTVTRRDDDPSYARTLNRWARISEKYQGWELYDPFAKAVVV